MLDAMRDLNRAWHKTLCPRQYELCPGLDLISSPLSSFPRLLIYSESQQHSHIDLGTWPLVLPSGINVFFTGTAKEPGMKSRAAPWAVA